MFLEKTNGLDCFAEAHLVGEDDTVAAGPGVQQEVESLQLVLAQAQRFVAYVLGLLLHRREPVLGVAHRLLVILGRGFAGQPRLERS